MNHIAREGETEYACIHRNRSGQDAGEIDFGIDVLAVESLSSSERLELVKTARQLADALEPYLYDGGEET